MIDRNDAANASTVADYSRPVIITDFADIKIAHFTIGKVSGNLDNSV